MARRSLSELRKSGRKLPRVAWLLDRGIIYVSAGLMAVLATTMVLFEGFSSYERMYEEPPVEEEFLQFKALESPSGDWAGGFLSVAPPGVNDWEVSSSTAPSHPFTFEECPSFGSISSTLYHTYSGDGSNVKIALNIYQPGTQAEAFEEYEESLSSCWDLDEKEVGNPSTTVLMFDRGGLFAYGDVLFFVLTDDEPLRDFLIPWAADRAVKTLRETGCHEFQVNIKDVERNLYLNQDKYTYKGLRLTEEVQTRYPVQGLPTQVFTPPREVHIIEKPEAPLPPDFELPDEGREMPVVPSVESSILTPEDFQKIVSFQIPDPEGPGCGWEWVGLSSPNVSADHLDKVRQEKLIKAQNTIDFEAMAYVNEEFARIRSVMPVARDIVSWNKYAVKLQAVYDKWEWLWNERAKIEGPWRAWIDDYNAWMNFDNTRANAVKQYKGTVESCDGKNEAYDKWDEKWGELYRERETASTTTTTTTTTVAPPSSTTSTSTTTTSTTIPEDIPPRPPVCSEDPKRPEILDATKPSKPKPPKISDKVTLPDSWPTPIPSPTVELI